ncbi:MAG TPA: hypothetical protein VHT96_10300 [Clostridia bacterium]|nr:hypothetical protein [Clostridia bacterium]
MTEEFKNIVKVACIYATSIIGAGFASGQEIMQFFSTYRSGGFLGILLSGILFAVVGGLVLDKICTERIRNFEEFLFPAFGWGIGWIIEAAVTVFMLCMFCIMLAGSGHVISDRTGMQLNLAALIMGVICMVFILTNIKGIVTLSTLTTPILVAGIILAGTYIIIFNSAQTSGITGYLRHVTGNWFVSSLLYVSYNSIPAIVIMCSLLPYLKTRRTAVGGGILGGLMLCVTAFIINIAIFLFYPDALKAELPILSILKSSSEPAGNLYAVILWLAMFLSAVTSGFCFTERAASMLKLDRRIITLVLCAAAVPLSTLGFSRLIAAIYPVFGYLGLFIIIVVLLQGGLKLRKGLSGQYGRK